MTLREAIRFLSPTAWAVSALLALVLAGLVWWGLTEPGRQKQKAAEATAASQYAGAATASARDAAQTTSERSAREAEIDHQSKEAEDAIRHAPDAERNAVARARLCMRDAYARDPACVELRRDDPR